MADYWPAFLVAVDSGAYAVWLLLTLLGYLTQDRSEQCIMGLMLGNLALMAISPAWGILGFFVSCFSGLILVLCTHGRVDNKKRD